MAKPAFDPSKPFEVPSKPAFDPSKPFEAVSDGPGLLEKVETGARSGIEGFTGGISEPFIGKINAVIGNLIRAGFDAESIGQFAKEAVSGAAIEQEYQKDIARRRALEAELPEVALPAEIAGAVLFGLGTGGATAAPSALKAATLAPRIATGLGEAAAKVVPTALGKAITKGAVSAASAEALKAAAQVPTGVMLPKEVDITQAAESGALLGGLPTAVVGGAKAVAKAAPKVLSALGGVSEEAIQKFLKDPGAVYRAKSPEMIKDLIDEQVQGLTTAIQKGDIAVGDAKRALSDAQKALSDEVKARSKEFSQAKFDLSQSLRSMRQKFDDSVQSAKQATESKMTAQKQILKEDAVNAVSVLKDRVIQGSKQSYDVLQRSGAKIDPKIPLEAAKDQLESLKVAGEIPTTGVAAQAYQKIQAYIDDLSRFKKPLNASEAKKKIQQLDQDTQYIINAGEFGDDAEIAIKAIRSAFDQQLKELPEYAEIMAQVAEDTRLLSQANKLFGNVERAQTKLSRIDEPARDLERQVLIQLGQKTGRDFQGQIDLITGMGKRLETDIIQKQLMGEPVGVELKAAERQLAKMQRPGAVEKVLAPIQKESPFAEEVLKAQQKALETQALLTQTQQRLKEIGPFAFPRSNINAIKTALSERNPEYTKFLENLSKLSGEDFVSYIKDLQLAEQFGKEFRIGSRNVNLWALGTGAAMYGITGDPTTALVVAGLGGGFGSMVDRFGPVMTQKVLERYLRIRGMPTVKKINQAFGDLPKEVLKSVKDDFARSYPVAVDDEVEIEPQKMASLKLDIMNSELSSVKKAQMISSMAKTGVIKAGDLTSVMMGKKTKGPIYVPKEKSDAVRLDKPDVLKALESRVAK